MPSNAVKSKIHIDELFDAMRLYNKRVMSISGNLFASSGKWTKAMEKAQEDFKLQIGDLADHIDWTRKDGLR